MPPIYAAWAACGSFMEREVDSAGGARGAAGKAALPGSIPGRGVHVGGRGVHREKERNSDAPCRAGDRKCPAHKWLWRVSVPAPGGCSGTPHGWFESTPEPVRVAVVVAAPLYGQSLAGALLKNTLPMMLRAWCQDWLLFGLCWSCRVRVLDAVSHS